MPAGRRGPWMFLRSLSGRPFTVDGSHVSLLKEGRTSMWDACGSLDASGREASSRSGRPAMRFLPELAMATARSPEDGGCGGWRTRVRRAQQAAGERP